MSHSGLKPQGLPRSRKITKADAFASALRMRVCARTEDFCLQFMAHRVNKSASVNTTPLELLTEDHAQLGLIIAKRFSKHAVRRNLIKRLAREAFRQRAAHLSAGLWVVRLQRNVNIVPLNTQQKRLWAVQLTELFEQGQNFANRLSSTVPVTDELHQGDT